MRNKIIIGCLLLGVLSAKAQDTRLSAVEYKERVLEYSRQIKQSSEERIAMQHAIKAAKTGFFPSVDFSGSYQYRINKYDLDFGPGMSVEMDHNTYSLGATVSQPIYAGGQIYNNYKAAQVQGKITEQAEELTTDNIVYSADLNYWTAAARKGMYDVMCQYVDIVGELANVLTIRFNDGQISKTDLLQVESRLKEAELNKSSAYKEYQIALQNLNSLMGVSPLDPIEVEDSITTYLALPLQVGEDVALRNRPDYAISELNIEYQKRQINLSKAKYNPSLAIGFQGTWGTPMLNVKGSDQLWTPAVFASLKIPLFRWGARFKTNRQQKAFIGIQKLQQSYITDTILEELSAATTKLTETEQQVKTAKENMALAEENLDLVTFSYNEGKSSMADVLSAQLSWTQAHTNLINAYLAEKMAVAEYRKVISE